MYITCNNIIQGQIESKNEFWINAGITSELLSVNATNVGGFKNRNRIGASIGIERRSYSNKKFNINYGIQVKSFRKSYVFSPNEVFIEDLNLCIPVLFNYHLKLNKHHFGNFNMDLNGIVSTVDKASYSTLDYEVQIERRTGIFPNLVIGFGYKFIRKMGWLLALKSIFLGIDIGLKWCFSYSKVRISACFFALFSAI